MLDGSNSCVVLPPNLFTNYTAISFEIWYADRPVNTPSSQLYNFSGPRNGMAFSLLGQGNYTVNFSSQVVTLASPAVGGTNHLVWTQDSGSNDARIYINGQLAGENTAFTFNPSSIGPTTNNCIGGGGGALSGPFFNGAILEFRAYQGALAPLDVACNDALGPDQLPSDPGALQDIRLVVPTPIGSGAKFRAAVFADFANLTNVNISTQPGLVLTSDNSNVVALAQNQMLETVSMGVADITAVWQGFSNTEAVTITTPQDIALLHRYSFSEQTNDWIAHDSVGEANGQVFASTVGVPPVPTFTGTGQLSFVGYPRGVGGHVALPVGLISSLSEVSIEAWVTWTPGNVALQYGSGAWQRIFDFGNNTGPPEGQGVSYLFLTPATDNVSFTPKSLLHAADHDQWQRR